jgi:P27 family predicted phage terminase small subunit
MVKPGPKPKTSGELARRGSWRAEKRKAEEVAAAGRQPSAGGKPPVMPKALVGYGRLEWRRLAPFIKKQGFGEEHRWLVMCACDAYGEWRQANELISKQGLFIKTVNGNIIQHPALAIKRSARKEIAKYADMLGWTVSSAGQMVPGGTAADKAKERFFKKVKSQK